ncbi:hypothetical protein C900_05013 [Fulvivirga imtechensis AK7]|uniref:Peptidase C45 hydrolase domain-containing protein n=1 Tax=Fulvivirga imtechensis AK7 TaxID=1237149 RepID=L8JKM3_9BACT|nr:carcinine hydrolase/isopenicillin-N N-acyltransferase family protein [Fulvivirga imtechensis]ELR69481.1 hypothetical protein C900_05013 [Fulvivirga imtechensis AK7]
MLKLNLKKLLTFFVASIFITGQVYPCSVLYYVDEESGKIYVANNEDYWYDVKPYIMIIPHSKKELARLWYGWDNFAQGGVNQAGLFFDGAVTPEQEVPEGYGKPKGNLGDELLAKCKTVDEAIAFLEKKKVALTNAHMMFGDSTGNAAVVEWVNGIKKIVPIEDNRLIMTNFLLSDSSEEHQCPRYNAIESSVRQLSDEGKSINIQDISNAISKAIQPRQKNENGKEGGTLYTTFINITDMKFALVYKQANTNTVALDLNAEFAKGKKQKIKLE